VWPTLGSRTAKKRNRTGDLDAADGVESAVDGVGNDGLDVAEHQRMRRVHKVRHVAFRRRLEAQLTVARYWSIEQCNSGGQPAIVQHLQNNPHRVKVLSTDVDVTHTHTRLTALCPGLPG